MKTALAHFELGDRVVVNGVDLTERVIALRYTDVAGETPRLELELSGEGAVIGDGVVYVKGVNPSDIREFLNSVSPAKLDSLVCERMGWETNSVGQLTLDILKEVAGGENSA